MSWGGLSEFWGKKPQLLLKIAFWKPCTGTLWEAMEFTTDSALNGLVTIWVLNFWTGFIVVCIIYMNFLKFTCFLTSIHCSYQGLCIFHGLGMVHEFSMKIVCVPQRPTLINEQTDWKEFVYSKQNWFN